MPTRFIHLRRREQRPTTTEFIFATGGATIGYEVSSLSDTEDAVEYYIAKCCDKDVFCRKIGRDVSQGRLLRGGGRTITIPHGLPRGEIRKILVEKYYESESHFVPNIRERVR